MLGVGYLGWVVWEGKMHMIRIGFVTDFYGSMLTQKKKCDPRGNFKVFVLGVRC